MAATQRDLVFGRGPGVEHCGTVFYFALAERVEGAVSFCPIPPRLRAACLCPFPPLPPALSLLLAYPSSRPGERAAPLSSHFAAATASLSIRARYLNRLTRDAAIVDNAGEREGVRGSERARRGARFRISAPDSRTSGCRSSRDSKRVRPYYGTGVGARARARVQ